MLKKRVYYISEKNLHLVRLIGSFIFFGAIIMILYSAAMMFEDWDAIREYEKCSASECKEILYKTTGVYPSGFALNTKQKFMIMVKPIAMLFFWAIVFFLGLLLYGCRRISIAFYEAENAEHLLHTTLKRGETKDEKEVEKKKSKAQ
ncbi:MAG: hypothetical protein N3F05_00500 [Candidatus Diapherotrites archaeon]|nr:hypothetical protein [Candidatus Diapherotrites archaeon]